MKKLLTLIICCSFVLACKSDKSGDNGNQDIEIIPISHATAVINWNDVTIYLDPTGGGKAFHDQKKADIVLITDIHEDHLNVETLQNIGLGDATVIAPKEVIIQLPESLLTNIKVMNNNEVVEEQGFKITAIPMYNLRKEARKFHPKGRGNGYVIEKNGKRLYIAGDTEDIPEMRSLKDIDIALIPMNLPYTMTMEKAADAVLEFAPEQVYPYHYRGKEGIQDVREFQKMVNEGNKEIEVVLKEWYPEAGEEK